MSNKNPENNNKNDGSIPKQVVNQIIEHTVGGFIIFYFNQETGEPELQMTFDTPAHSLALQKYISDWQDAVDEVNLDNNCNALHQGILAQEIEEIDPNDDDEEDDLN